MESCAWTRRLRSCLCAHLLNRLLLAHRWRVPTVSIENLIKTTCPVFVQANFENCLQIIVLQAIDL